MLVAPEVRLVRAANPSPMTLEGTNSYLVGTGAVALIDPGPDDPAHVEALLAAARPLGRIAALLVTHHHPDHLPAARVLRERTGAPLLGHPDLPGCDRALADGEVVRVGATELRAIATPGHTPDHLCFLRVADGVLFSGDHVLGRGTTVINPGDGDLAAYLDALRKLQGLALTRILPGHGPVVADPAAKLAEYYEHRLLRERQVLAALAAGPRTVAELVAAIYQEVDPRLHPVAARNVTAHLLKLEREGRTAREGEAWRLR
jgi:glyoxylase-like metal-dependent hydrolase (beta-lactamase superfamily II)